ncbi:hypothetical protein [Priestia megaterium]|uniref:hypothetical protein n=1 Tax=Priestia megaterium TaxID=1404 RepID=UPI001B3A4764|nr:hypothetical protein [Priestia megaterium]
MLTKENPNDESRFLMENQLRSDFFICKVNVGFTCIGASSCGLEGKTKTPAGKTEQMRPRRSASDEEAHRPPAESEVLHGNPQRCHKRFILAH